MMRQRSVRILFDLTGSPQELVRSLPLIAAISDQFPSTLLHALVSPDGEALAGLVPCLRQLLIVRPPTLFSIGSAIRELSATIHRGEYSCFVSASQSWVPLVASAIGGVPSRVGGGTQLARWFFLTHPISWRQNDEYRHKVYQNLDLAKVFGILPTPTLPPLQIRDHRLSRPIREFLLALEHDSKPVAVIYFDRDTPELVTRPFHLRHAIRHLMDTGLWNVAVCGQVDDPSVMPLTALHLRYVNVLNVSTVDDEVALLQRASVVISPQTAFSDLAGLLNCPILQFLGPTAKPLLEAPLSTAQKLIDSNHLCHHVIPKSTCACCQTILSPQSIGHMLDILVSADATTRNHDAIQTTHFVKSVRLLSLTTDVDQAKTMRRDLDLVDTDFECGWRSVSLISHWPGKTWFIAIHTAIQNRVNIVTFPNGSTLFMVCLSLAYRLWGRRPVIWFKRPISRTFPITDLLPKCRRTWQRHRKPIRFSNPLATIEWGDIPKPTWVIPNADPTLVNPPEPIANPVLEHTYIPHAPQPLAAMATERDSDAILEIDESIRILVVRPDTMGGVTLMVPMLNHLKKLFPDAKIYTFQHPDTVDLLKGHPAVERVLVDRRGEGLVGAVGGFFEGVSYLRSFDFDIAIFSHLAPYYAGLAFLARIPIRIGDGGQLMLRLLLTDPVKLPFRDATVHMVEHNMMLLAGLRRHFPKIPPAAFSALAPDIDLRIEEADSNRVSIILKGCGLDQAPFIVVHPGTSAPNTGWIPERYAELIDMIQHNGDNRVILTGFGPQEMAKCDVISASCRIPPIHLCGTIVLSELKSIVAQSQVVITGNNCVAQLASAFARPVIVLCPESAMKPFHSGPWANAHKMIPVGRVGGRETTVQRVYEAVAEMRSGVTKTISETKRSWFIKSMRVLIYIGNLRTMDRDAAPSDSPIAAAMGYPDLIEAYRTYEQLQALGFKVFVACGRGSPAELWQVLSHQPPDLIASPKQLKTLVQFIAKNDVGVVQLFPYKNSWWWQTVVRNVVAPFVYIPPLVTGTCSMYVGEDLIDYFMAESKILG